MTFILRVNGECSDSEMSTKLIHGLATMASLQDTHTGVLCYHFSRPEPETRPNFFEFTEVYGNEAAFWGHSADPKFLKAYSSLFPSDKIKSITWEYGPISEKVKGVCDTHLSCRYPQQTAGSILAQTTFDRTSSYDQSNNDGPILVMGRIQAKEGKVKEILDLITKLSSEANGGVVVCFASVPEQDKEPNRIELIQLCTTNSHLVAHFGVEQGKQIMISIKEFSTSTEWRGYGRVVPLAVESLAEVGVQVVARETGAGFVLHPKADPAGP